MKKIIALGFVLFLTACSGIEGATSTSCTDVENGVAGAGVGTTTVVIESDYEQILQWNVHTSITRAELNSQFLNDVYMTDDEIHDLFATYSVSSMDGVQVVVSEINDDYVTLTQTYNYSLMLEEDLNFLWRVDNFSQDVTLSSAIAGLENQGATCEVMTLHVD